MRTIRADGTGETIVELDETFFVNLTAVSANATLNVAASQAAATILNDDVVIPEVSVSGSSVIEKNAPETPTAGVTFSLDGLAPTDVVITFATVAASGAGNATAGVDFTSVSGAGTFGSVETSATGGGPVIGDGTV